MKTQAARSRIPSELTADEIRAVRADPRLQREIALAFGLTLSAVSLIKARKCRADVPEPVVQVPVVQVPVVQTPEPRPVTILVCPPAKAAGHKPLPKHTLKLKPIAESWKPTTKPIVAPDPDDSATPSMPQQYLVDDWLLI